MAKTSSKKTRVSSKHRRKTSYMYAMMYAPLSVLRDVKRTKIFQQKKKYNQNAKMSAFAVFTKKNFPTAYERILKQNGKLPKVEASKLAMQQLAAEYNKINNITKKKTARRKSRSLNKNRPYWNK